MDSFLGSGKTDTTGLPRLARLDYSKTYQGYDCDSYIRTIVEPRLRPL